MVATVRRAPSVLELSFAAPRALGETPVTLADGPGYHTRVPNGRPVQETRVAADLVLELLAHGDPGSIADATSVLATLLDAQVGDPTAEHFGLWGWYLEEPPDQMAPADWNWADFIGARLAQVLATHADALPADLAARTLEALRRAALAIFRRNVGPDYSNIAVMGAVVCAAAGELLELPFLLDYARRRLEAVWQQCERTATVQEYRSPAYSIVLIGELERAHAIVHDGAFLLTAERLRRLVWLLLGRQYHPSTGQLIGPMSRAYSDRLSEDGARFISERVEATTGLGGAMPVPEDARRLFLQPHDGEERFPVAYLPRGPVVATTWTADGAALGSADVEFAWGQRRPLLGHWRTPDGVAVLRARMLLDGHDLSAAWCATTQSGPQALSAWWLSYDSGDTHPTLDRPEASVFTLSTLVLRVSVDGVGTRGEERDGVYWLECGGRGALVAPAVAGFAGQPAEWRLAVQDDMAAAELVLYDGARRELDFHEVLMAAAFGLRIQARSANRDAPLPARSPAPHRRSGWSWCGLNVTAPATSTPFIG